MLSFVLALAIQCPIVDPNYTCNLPVGPILPETVMKWARHDDGWPCDGSVWWRVLGPSGEWNTFRCSTWLDPDTGERNSWCPQGVAPVKYETMHAGGSVAVTVQACNDIGCSLGCTRVVEWPAVCEFSDRAGVLACFGVTE